MEALGKNGVQNKIMLYPNSCNIDACYNEVDLYLKTFIKNLVQIGTVVSEKIRFEFLYVHNLVPRAFNTHIPSILTYLQYSHTFIYSIRCLLLLTFKSLAAIIFEKSTVFTFSCRKALSYQI